MKLVDMKVEEFEQILGSRLATAITQSEMRVIELLSERTDESFHTFEDKMDRRFQALHTEMYGCFQSLHDEMDSRFQSLHEEMDGRFQNLQNDMDECFNEVAYAIDGIGSLIDQDNAQLGKRLTRLEKRSP